MSDRKAGDAVIPVMFGAILGVALGVGIGLLVGEHDARVAVSKEWGQRLIDDGQAYWSIDPKTGERSLKYTHPASEGGE
jgi:hypothetical protein